jgi:hypothetical protein
MKRREGTKGGRGGRRGNIGGRKKKEDEVVEKEKGKGVDPLVVTLLHAHLSKTSFVRVLKKAPHPSPPLTRGRKFSWDMREYEVESNMLLGHNVTLDSPLFNRVIVINHR